MWCGSCHNKWSDRKEHDAVERNAVIITKHSVALFCAILHISRHQNIQGT